MVCDFAVSRWYPIAAWDWRHLAEKRRQDKDFGKMVKSVMSDKNKVRKN